jgi:AcrR family transcriptional regulator
VREEAKTVEAVRRHTGKQRQYQAAIQGLLLHPTNSEAAKAAGISEGTLYRYLNDDGFKALYNEAKRRMLDGTINKLRLASSGAVDVLIAIAHDPASPQSARVAASKVLLETAIRAGAIEEIEERLAAMEAMTIEGER